MQISYVSDSLAWLGTFNTPITYFGRLYGTPGETYDTYLGLRCNIILINIFVGEKNADELIEFCDYDSF